MATEVAIQEDKPLTDRSYAVLDLEMTGLKPEHDRICEVGVVRGEGDQVESEYTSLVCPEVKVGKGALQVHGLTDEQLAMAPGFTDIADELRRQLLDAVLVGHNIPFDLQYLQAAFERTGTPFEPMGVVDTLQIARRVFAFRRNNLASVSDALGVRASPNHRALGDARVTREVYCRMLEILDPENTVTLPELSGLLEALAPGSAFRMKQQALLREGYRQRRSVYIEYPSGSDDKYDFLRREIAVWHVKLPRVQGWCYMRNAERVFRVDRMRTVELANRDYSIPEFVKRI